MFRNNNELQIYMLTIEDRLPIKCVEPRAPIGARIIVERQVAADFLFLNLIEQGYLPIMEKKTH